MKNRKWIPVIKWSIYYLSLVILFSLQTAPGFLQFFGVKPVLLLSVMVCVSMNEGILSSAIFAAVSGLLWDISADKLFGFNGLIFLCASILISLVCIHYLRAKLLNALMFCAAAALLQALLNYVFYFLIWNRGNSLMILYQDLLPSALYTVLVTPLVFWGIRKVSLKYNAIPRA